MLQVEKAVVDIVGEVDAKGTGLDTQAELGFFVVFVTLFGSHCIVEGSLLTFGLEEAFNLEVFEHTEVF